MEQQDSVQVQSTDEPFAIDWKRRRRIALTQRRQAKSYPLFLTLLWVFGIGFFVVCYLLIGPMETNAPSYQTGAERHFTGIFGAFIVTLFIDGLPYCLTWAFMLRIPGGEVSEKQAERLWLDEEGIVNAFYPRYDSSRFRYLQTKVHFSQITRIEHNTRHDMFKLYAPVHVHHFYGIRGKDAVADQTVFDRPEEAFRIYYLYYENSERLLDEVSRRSGIPIKTVDTVESRLREKRLK